MSIELNNFSRIVIDSPEKLTTKDLRDIINKYLDGSELKRLQRYDDYYESHNEFITGKVRDKIIRDKTPNNYVPTAYYATVVDTMAGYMFDNVKYNPRDEIDIPYSEALNDILEANSSEVKEMKTGVKALAYNKGVELVYTVGDGKSTADIRYTDIDPRQMIVIYDNSIEPEIFCGIWIRISNLEDYDYKVDVIYNDEWQYYNMNDAGLVMRAEPKILYFSECPVVVYNANDMGVASTFAKIIQYIDALDFVITGNANDIEKLTDAILVMTKLLKDEELNHMGEMKAIFDVEKDRDILPYYLEKQSDPAFREYASKLLIQEIHKHAHVIDWYSPDSGLSGDVSAKALRTRLFDMDMYSRRIEKVYKKGAKKRIDLITELMLINSMPVGFVDIIYNRTTPDDFEDKAPVLNGLTFVSDEYKMEMVGIDVEKEKKRLTAQKDENMARMDLGDSNIDLDPEDDADGEE
jgi:SPP1 family phage portal protein